MILSKRLSTLNPSKTIQLDAKVKQYIQEGIDIINLGVGEPAEPTPEAIKQAGIQAIIQDQTRYSSPTGILPLKKAICKKLLNDNHFSGPIAYQPEQIVISAGAKQAVFNALMAIVDPGDEVFIPAPYWVTYPDLVRLLGGIPIIMHTTEKNQYKITIEQLDQYWQSPKGKLLILNTPANPTGMMYTKKELEDISTWLQKKDMYCLSDEIYEYITYDGVKHISPASISKKMYQRTILVNGMSKAYSMTGWRIGYTASSLPLAEAMGALQSQSTHHPSNISQYAALEALQHDPKEFLAPMLKTLNIKRNLTLNILEKLKKDTKSIQYITPQGSFYVWINVQKILTSNIQSIQDDEQLSKYLLEKFHVALVPGIAFGQPGALRLSFSPSLSSLKKGLERLSNGIRSLQPSNP